MSSRRELWGTAGDSLVSAAGRWSQALGEEFGLDADDRYRLELCVEELTTNLSMHVATPVPATLSVTIDRDVLELVVTDAGPPFDPWAVASTSAPDDVASLAVGGGGLRLMRAFSDHQAHAHVDGRNVTTLRLMLAEPADDPPRPAGLDDVRILRGVPAAEVDAALGPTTILEASDDVVLIDLGGDNDRVLFVLDGPVRGYLDRVGGDARFEPRVGDCLGEMSVIDAEPSSAAVVAGAGSRLLVVDAATFLDRVLAIPLVARNLLSALVARTRHDNALLVDRVRQRVELEQSQREMGFARDVQRSLLPTVPLLPDVDGWDCAALLRPAREVGGDFYDVLADDDGHVLVVVADVCGKGLPASLSMVRALSSLRADALGGPARTADDLEGRVARLNELLCTHNDTDQFVTAFLGLLDTTSGRMRFVNAGHPPPLLRTDRGDVSALGGAVNPPIGLVPGLAFRSGECELPAGSRLLLYSDGVTEAEDGRGAMLGAEALAELVGSLGDVDAAAMVAAVVARVDAFSDGARQSDDITVLGLLHR